MEILCLNSFFRLLKELLSNGTELLTLVILKNILKVNLNIRCYKRQRFL